METQKVKRLFTSHEIGPRLIQAGILPPHCKRATIKLEPGVAVTIEAEFFLTGDGAEFAKVLAESKRESDSGWQVEDPAKEPPEEKLWRDVYAQAKSEGWDYGLPFVAFVNSVKRSYADSRT